MSSVPPWVLAWVLTPAAFGAVTLPVLAMGGADLVQRRERVSRWFLATPIVVFLLGFVPMALKQHYVAMSGAWLYFELLETAWRSFWPAAFAAGLCALVIAASRALVPFGSMDWRRVVPGWIVAGGLGAFGQVAASSYHAVAVALGAGGTGVILALMCREPTPRQVSARGAVLGLHLCGVFTVVWCGALHDFYTDSMVQFGIGAPHTFWPTAVPVSLLPLALLVSGFRPDRETALFFLPVPVLAGLVTLAFWVFRAG